MWPYLATMGKKWKKADISSFFGEFQIAFQSKFFLVVHIKIDSNVKFQVI
jgi:hypothetical protein